MNYYIEYENEIKLYDTNKESLERAILFAPQYQDCEIKKTTKEIIAYNNKFVFKSDVISELLEDARAAKYKENENVRDEFLLQPVIYNEVAFDSDLEQRQNIDFAVRSMGDEETRYWVGADGITKLLCTKEDLTNIGMLLVAKINYVWETRNPEIKIQIRDAKSIQALDAIDISYNMEGVMA